MTLNFSAWSSLQALDDVDESPLDGPGVYQLRAVDGKGTPIEIGRWLGVDSGGLLYIGSTGDSICRRVGRLRDGIDQHSKGHTAGKKRFILARWVPAYSEQLADAHREYRWASTDPAEAQSVESDLLMEYVRAFGETPPLNGDFPYRMRPEVWEERHVGRP